MSEDTTPQALSTSELASAIISRAQALSILVMKIKDCAAETLSDGCNDLHEYFEETDDLSAADIRDKFDRVATLLNRSLDTLKCFEPEPYSFETEVTKQMSIEVSASLEYEVMAFSQESADAINEELYDDCKMERADVEELSSYDVTLPDPWNCEDIN